MKAGVNFDAARVTLQRERRELRVSAQLTKCYTKVNNNGAKPGK